MKTLIKKIIKNKILLKWLFRFFSYLHNKAYVALSTIAILQNNGLHPKHRILNYHKFFTDHIDSTDTILDIGCGNGANAFDIAEKAKTVVGIDIEEKYIREANKKHPKPNITYIVGDATVYLFEKKFDKVILSNVLEHIEHRVEFLKKIHPLTDRILFRVPLITRDWLPVYKKEQGSEYRLDLTHFTEYTVEQAKEELAQSGWKFQEFSVQFGEIWGILVPDAQK
jgi:SAM-dependent methyltransferase